MKRLLFVGLFCGLGVSLGFQLYRAYLRYDLLHEKRWEIHREDDRTTLVPRANFGSVEQLRHIALFTETTHLDLWQVAYGRSDGREKPRITADAIEYIDSVLPKLESMELPGCPLDSEHYLNLSKIVRLRGLRIRGNSLTKRDLAVLAGLPKLESLVLSCPNFQEDDQYPDWTKRLNSQLWKFPSLRKLTFAKVHFTPGVTRQLADLSKLESLDLGLVMIAKGEFAHLAESKTLKRLRVSQVPYLTPNKLKPFAEASRLESLTVYWGDRDFEYPHDWVLAMAKIKSLKTVTFNQTNVKQESLDELKRLRPDLEVVVNNPWD